jgi:hypothetical protein
LGGHCCDGRSRRCGGFILVVTAKEIVVGHWITLNIADKTRKP